MQKLLETSFKAKDLLGMPVAEVRID